VRGIQLRDFNGARACFGGETWIIPKSRKLEIITESRVETSNEGREGEKKAGEGVSHCPHPMRKSSQKKERRHFTTYPPNSEDATAKNQPTCAPPGERTTRSADTAGTSFEKKKNARRERGKSTVRATGKESSCNKGYVRKRT